MGSPFASMTTSDPIPLPFDEGQWIRVRKPTGRQYEVAQEFHREGFVRGDRWADVYRDALEKGADSKAVQKALADPLTGYNRYELVRAGLAEWSYPQAIPPYVTAAKHAEDVKADPAKVDCIDDLDDDAIDFFAREVLKLAKPALFVATEADAEEQKKSA